MLGKESMEFNAFAKRRGMQCNYTGQSKEIEGQEKDRESNILYGNILGGIILARWEDGLKDQEENLILRENGVSSEENNKGEGILKTSRKSSCKRLNKNNQTESRKYECAGAKRKFFEEEDGKDCLESIDGDVMKRLKYDEVADLSVDRMEVMIGGCQWASRPNTMKNIYWNVRGLGSSRTVRRLRNLCKQHNPHMVFLMETKLDQKWRESEEVAVLIVESILRQKGLEEVCV
ncbi:BEACH domain-containing lvsC [Gossypium australe]|uniref:BEACH domain-containing lvsC n=1 Tax=Gossypium australe TaxID=47621 RepID=A0A5B6UW76_9ROSI|nr:BEACH domain-containing lvsC [Gossypium australe]